MFDVCAVETVTAARAADVAPSVAAEKTTQAARIILCLRSQVIAVFSKIALQRITYRQAIRTREFTTDKSTALEFVRMLLR
jgi:hypothetical protein